MSLLRVASCAEKAVKGPKNASAARAFMVRVECSSQREGHAGGDTGASRPHLSLGRAARTFHSTTRIPAWAPRPSAPEPASIRSPSPASSAVNSALKGAPLGACRAPRASLYQP